MRQVDVHVEHGDGVLHALALVCNPDRMANGFDAYFVDSDLAGIRVVLHIGDSVFVADGIAHVASYIAFAHDLFLELI
jgi:hypothetical protein